MSLLRRVRMHARLRPGHPAIAWDGGTIGYAELVRGVEGLAAYLRSLGTRTLALAVDNGPAWALLDLAALEAGVVLVPIPPFFAADQVRHCLRRAAVEWVVTDRPADLGALAGDAVAPAATRELTVAGRTLGWVPAGGDGRATPPGVTKVTFTSGTTGEPRGVMLGWHHLEGVVDSLARAVGVRREDRLVALMLLAVLLENVGTLYAALWAGATVVLPSVAETGLLGAAGLDAGRLHATLTDYRATIAVFAPQVLQGLVEHIEAGAQAPRALRFAAVGGHRSRPACSAARPPSACPCSKATDSRSARRSCA